MNTESWVRCWGRRLWTDRRNFYSEPTRLRDRFCQPTFASMALAHFHRSDFRVWCLGREYTGPQLVRRKVLHGGLHFSLIPSPFIQVCHAQMYSESLGGLKSQLHHSITERKPKEEMGPLGGVSSATQSGSISWDSLEYIPSVRTEGISRTRWLFFLNKSHFPQGNDLLLTILLMEKLSQARMPNDTQIHISKHFKQILLGGVAYALNPSNQETEVGRALSLRPAWST